MKLHIRDAPPRSIWSLEQAGVHPLLARLYAARGVNTADELDDGLARLLPPSGLSGASRAALLLADALQTGQMICVVADYDCDGATACAVALRGLKLLGAQNVTYLVPDRVVDGYGLTAPIAERVKALGADVLVTVDNGIASFEGVARAKELGMQVLVTDHHLPALSNGTLLLPDADVIVNPNQPGCQFESKSIAGVGVMFYVLLALRAELRQRGRYIAPTLVAARTALPPEGAGLARGGPSLAAAAPTLVAARTALPPEGAGLARGGPSLAAAAPTLVAARTALPPEGAGLARGGPSLAAAAPTLVAARTALPLQGATLPEAAPLKAVQARSSGLGAAASSPEGAGLARGGPSLAAAAPTLVAARTALPLQGATLPEAAPLKAVQARSSGLGAAASSPEGAGLARGGPSLAAAAPTLVAARTALPLKGATLPEAAPLEAVQARSSGLGAAASSPEGAGIARGGPSEGSQPVAEPRLDSLLPLVALGTVADVVKLDSNNRRLVAQGLRRIRAGHLPAGLASLFTAAGRNARTATTFDFGFALGPRINAAGRLSDMTLGIECLLTDDPVRADELARTLDGINRERRDIESGMREQAQLAADAMIDEADEPPPAVAIFDPEFHEGVVGIVASRIKDKLHRPTFVFAASQAPGKSHELKGSGRSIAGFHLRDALDLVAKRCPDVLIKFGGHAMAAGCTIREEHFEQFEHALQQVAREQLDAATLMRRLDTDGPLAAVYRRADVVDTLHQAVWGQGFAPPTFSEEVEVVSQRIVGERHLSLKLKHQGQPVDGIWFGHTEQLPARVTLAFRLDADEYQGVRRVRFLVEAAET